VGQTKKGKEKIILGSCSLLQKQRKLGEKPSLFFFPYLDLFSLAFPNNDKNHKTNQSNLVSLK